MTDPSAETLRKAFRGRASRQRLAIAAIVDRTRNAFSARELTCAVRAVDPRTGLATVYRALGEMVESGFVEQVGMSDGAALYARCRSQGHHHHVVCTGCGRVAEAECDMEKEFRRVSAASGFRVTGHDFKLFGLCPVCVGSEEREDLEG